MFGSSKTKAIFILLAILIIASFFRLWQLENIPPGVYPDEAMNANDAISKAGKVFYPENNGREGLFINLLALAFSVFGISVFSLKIVPAIAGILTVAGLYFLSKELFKSEKIALLSSLFLAVSFWHVNFSRIAFRAILVPLVLTFTFYFLFRGFRTKKAADFLISGVIFGLGFHTYISFRLSILLVFLFLLIFLWIYIKEKGIKKFFSFSAIFLITAFIVALPIGIYFLENPQDFVSRATGISVFSAENPIKAFSLSAIAHLGMFNFIGDGNWRHNFSLQPQLFWPVGILFLIGVVFSVKKTILALKEKDYFQFSSYFLIISWLLIMLLPGMLTFEGIPHALRTIGAIPPAYILSAIGGYWLFEFMNRKINKKVVISVAIIFLLITGYFQFSKYFIFWAERPEVKSAFETRYNGIGNYLNSLPLDTKKYVIVNEIGSSLYGISIPGQSVMFIESTKFGKPTADYIKYEDIGKIEAGSKSTEVVALYERGIFEELQKLFPQGKIIEKDNFKVYKIK